MEKRGRKKKKNSREQKTSFSWKTITIFLKFAGNSWHRWFTKTLGLKEIQQREDSIEAQWDGFGCKEAE